MKIDSLKRSKRSSQLGASAAEAMLAITLIAVLVIGAVRSIADSSIVPTLANTSACLGGGSATTMSPPVGGSEPPVGICPGDMLSVTPGGPDWVTPTPKPNPTPSFRVFR